MSEDILKKMAINQGYVPVNCTLPGSIVMGIINENKNPCYGCNADKNKCKIAKICSHCKNPVDAKEPDSEYCDTCRHEMQEDRRRDWAD